MKLKKIKKLIFCSLLTTNILLFVNPSYAYTIENSDLATTERIDVIEWRYKIVDERLYRRQYNVSTDKWIGNWELVS